MNIAVDPDWWKSLFDDVYLITDARSVCNAAVTRREIDIFSRLIPLAPGDRILDLCGGHGRHSIELSRRGFTNCTVMDYSLFLLQTGRADTAGTKVPVGFIQADARQSAVTSGTMRHVLVLGNALGYMPGGISDMQILSEAYRVLTNGGWLLVDVANGDYIKKDFNANAWHEIGSDTVVCRQRELVDQVIQARELVMSRKTGLIRDRTYCIRIYTPDEMKALLERTGFGNIRLVTDFQSLRPDQDVGFMNHRMIAVAQKV